MGLDLILGWLVLGWLVVISCRDPGWRAGVCLLSSEMR